MKPNITHMYFRRFSRDMVKQFFREVRNEIYTKEQAQSKELTKLSLYQESQNKVQEQLMD